MPEVLPASVFYAGGKTVNVFLDLASILNLKKWSGINFLLYCLSPMTLTTFLFFLHLSHCLSRFARLAATTFITQGIPVYLFSNITPTPFVVSNCFLF